MSRDNLKENPFDEKSNSEKKDKIRINNGEYLAANDSNSQNAIQPPTLQLQAKEQKFEEEEISISEKSQGYQYKNAEGAHENNTDSGVDPSPKQLKSENPESESENGEKKENGVSSIFQLASGGGDPNPQDESNGSGVRNNGLPKQLKSGIENLSGFSMDDVNVQYNSDKPAQLQAHAYAQGSDIHLGPGQEKHLPHEAWHVVQQKQGRVKPTTQLKAFSINDDAGLEIEADVMGKRAMKHANKNSGQIPLKNKSADTSFNPVQAKLFNIREVSDDDKKVMGKGLSSVGKLNKAIEKYNGYEQITKKDFKNDDKPELVKQLRTLITISSLAEKVKLESGGKADINTMNITFANIKSEIAYIQSMLTPNQQGGQNGQNLNSPSGDSSSNFLEAGINHFAPSMEATALAPVDATSLALTAAADEHMGEEITSVDGASSGFSIGLGVAGQITSISSMILATKNIIDANNDIDKSEGDANKIQIAKEERQEAVIELVNGATGLLKATSGMADSIVNLNPQNLADSVLSSATQTSGSIAGAAGIVWNAYQLVINAKGSDDARKAYGKLDEIHDRAIFDKAIDYSKERLRRRAIRKGVAAASGGLGIVAGAVGIAIAAGVAATPAGWALAAAGLIIGLSILGYKIGKSLYKKHHRRMKAKELILHIDSTDEEERGYAETYLSSVLGLDLGWCRKMKAADELGTLNNEIVHRMENKREIIAAQIQHILKTKSEGDDEYDAAAQIMNALKIDLELAKSDEGKKKIMKELASW